MMLRIFLLVVNLLSRFTDPRLLEGKHDMVGFAELRVLLSSGPTTVEVDLCPPFILKFPPTDSIWRRSWPDHHFRISGRGLLLLRPERERPTPREEEGATGEDEI